MSKENNISFGAFCFFVNVVNWTVEDFNNIDVGKTFKDNRMIIDVYLDRLEADGFGLKPGVIDQVNDPEWEEYIVKDILKAVERKTEYKNREWI